MSENTVKLKVCSFGFAFGLIWGLGMLLLSWCGWWFGSWAHGLIHTMGSAYLGMAPTFVGGIFGFLWGFVDFFIFGALVALVYNYCTKCCGTVCCPVKKKEK